MQDRLEFTVVLARELVSAYAEHMLAGLPKEERPSVGDYATAKLASDLMKAGRRLHRLAEANCNGFRDTADQDANERATERCQARVVKALSPYGITARFGGDPRGVMIELVLPRTKRTNGWGGEGYCVPR